MSEINLIQSIKERRSLSGARERRSQKCERERERRSGKKLRARARAALGKIRERWATSGALQISENYLSKCSIHLNFDLLLMLELNKKSTMQCVLCYRGEITPKSDDYSVKRKYGSLFTFLGEREEERRSFL